MGRKLGNESVVLCLIKWQRNSPTKQYSPGQPKKWQSLASPDPLR